MSVLGDKIAANILAQTAGVPSIPWSGNGLTAELTGYHITRVDRLLGVIGVTWSIRGKLS